MATRPQLKKAKDRLGEIRRLAKEKDEQINTLLNTADDKQNGEDKPLDLKTIKELGTAIGELEKEGSELMETIGIIEGIGGSLGREGIPEVEGRPTDQPTTVGDRFLADPQTREYFEKNQITDGSPWKSPEVKVGSLIRDLVYSSADAAGGAFVVRPDRKPIVDQFYQKPLTIFDIITMGETGSNLVEYMRITGVTNNAAGTPEATATGDGSGAAPESAMAFQRVQESVKDITHFIPVTNNMLQDGPQTRTEIDSFLIYGVRQSAQNQMINGAGGDDFTGIFNTTNTQTQAWDTNLITTTRKSRTKVRKVGRVVPNAWLMAPEDWEGLDLLADNEQRYYYGGPATLGTPRLWGTPVVENEDVTAGVSLLGDFLQAILWDRLQSTIFAANQHSDFAIRRMTALVGVYRGAFGVKRPQAFVETAMVAP